jgi:hypothetical protein
MPQSQSRCVHVGMIARCPRLLDMADMPRVSKACRDLSDNSAAGSRPQDNAPAIRAARPTMWRNSAA